MLIIPNFLGVIIDEKLNWSYHINLVKRKVSKGLGIMHKAKKVLNESTLITLYYSFIYPYLHYGILAWGMTFKCFLDPLIKIQKRAVRVIAMATRDAHTNPIFRRLNILNISNIYVLNVMMFMLKYKRRLLPNVFEGMFVVNNEIHGHYTRQATKFHSATGRLEIVRRSIRVQGVCIWNLLSNRINSDCSPVTFKFRIKKCLISTDFEYM